MPLLSLSYLPIYKKILKIQFNWYFYFSFNFIIRIIFLSFFCVRFWCVFQMIDVCMHASVANKCKNMLLKGVGIFCFLKRGNKIIFNQYNFTNRQLFNHHNNNNCVFWTDCNFKSFKDRFINCFCFAYQMAPIWLFYVGFQSKEGGLTGKRQIVHS